MNSMSMLISWVENVILPWYNGGMRKRTKPPTKNLILRLPVDLHTALVEKAEAEHRSLNGQVVHMIEAGLGLPDSAEQPQPQAN
jgi:hypothetical protein